MKLRFTPSGQAQFLDVLRYLKRENPKAAIDFRRRAEKVLKRLERFPDSGRRLPEFPDLRYREVIVSPYRFFYRLERKVVWIVAIWHGAISSSRPTAEHPASS